MRRILKDTGEMMREIDEVKIGESKYDYQT